MQLPSLITPQRLVLALSFVGAAIFYLWQPVSEYFLTGAYDENVVIQIESEKLKIDKDSQLLVLHVELFNKGNVAVDISGKNKHGKLTVDVRKFDKPQNAKWLEQEKMSLVNTADILRHHKDGYSIEPNAMYDETEAIALPLGFYWVTAKLTFDDGDYVDQSIAVKLDTE
jgi:hypothetical protein